jgi:hypothetical protein
MSRVLPKGEFLPVPLLCRVVFGAPVAPEEGEDRHAFLHRARDALLALDPRPENSAMMRFTLSIGWRYAVLIVASTGRRILRGAPAEPSPTLVNLTQRINAWWVMVILMSIAFLFGKNGILLLFAFDVLRGAARVRDADLHAPQRPPGAARHVRHRAPGSSTGWSGRNGTGSSPSSSRSTASSSCRR